MLCAPSDRRTENVSHRHESHKKSNLKKVFVDATNKHDESSFIMERWCDVLLKNVFSALKHHQILRNRLPILHSWSTGIWWMMIIMMFSDLAGCKVSNGIDSISNSWDRKYEGCCRYQLWNRNLWLVWWQPCKNQASSWGVTLIAPRCLQANDWRQFPLQKLHHSSFALYTTVNFPPLEKVGFSGTFFLPPSKLSIDSSPPEKPWATPLPKHPKVQEGVKICIDITLNAKLVTLTNLLALLLNRILLSIVVLIWLVLNIPAYVEKLTSSGLAETEMAHSKSGVAQG